MEIRSLSDYTAKKKSYVMHYFAAVGGAIVLGVILKVFFTWGTLLVGLVMAHWTWILGAVVALVIIKRFFRRRA